MEVVWPDSCPKKREAIFKLRYDAYVVDKGFSSEGYSNGLLQDDYDEVHPSLLFTHDGIPVGTFRIEINTLGRMDIENTWKLPPNSASFCRYAVRKDYRGKLKTVRGKGIYFAMFSVLARLDIPVTVSYLATNQAGLMRLYRVFATPVDLTPSRYLFPNGDIHEGYTLWKVDIGKAWTLKRLKARIYLGSLKILAPLAIKLSKIL